MPGFDRTGPQGFGPGSGRGFGPCGQGRSNNCFGRGRVFGRRGFGQRAMPVQNISKEEQKQLLENELKQVELEKKEIEKELKELE